jgi:hypothetical protein
VTVSSGRRDGDLFTLYRHKDLPESDIAGRFPADGDVRVSANDGCVNHAFSTDLNG